MPVHVLFVGGVDFDLRIPFILAMRERGFRVSVASSGDPAPFRRNGLDFVSFPFDRYMTPLSDMRAIRRLRRILEELQPDIAQGFDTKPCLMLPLAVGHGPVRTVRTICGRAWVYSSRSPIALAARPAYRMLHRAASTRTAATVFEINSDRDFFVRARMAGRNGLVIPAGGGGIDVVGFERALAEATSPEALKEELGLSGAEIVITVTRVTRQKGIGTLLKAARAVHEQRPGVRFLLVGPRDSEGAAGYKQDRTRPASSVCDRDRPAQRHSRAAADGRPVRLPDGVLRRRPSRPAGGGPGEPAGCGHGNARM